MTTEEAIKTFECFIENAEYHISKFESTFHGWKSNLREDVDLFKMAIAALRAQTDFNGTYVNISWLKQVEAERDALKEAMNSIVHCRDCKHLYFKDMSRYCSYKVGPCWPNGFCDYGERGDA